MSLFTVFFCYYSIGFCRPIVSSQFRQKQSHHNGFTLVELLVTLVIVSLLAVIALPSFTDYMKRYEARRTVNSIRPVLLEARVIALTRRQNVVVCPTKNKRQCDKTTSSLMSFVDINANLKRDQAEEIINYLPATIRFGEIKFNVGLGRPYIRYFPDTGKPRGYFANVTYCPDDGNLLYAKAVILNEHGRARISFDSNGDGVEEKGGGRPLVC